MSDWGQGAKNNDIGWGQGAVNNDIGWGAVHANSWSGDTNIVGTIFNMISAPVTYGDYLVGGSGIIVTDGLYNETATISYQWKRNGTNISGANTNTYVPLITDEGLPITCLVTATSASQTASYETPPYIVKYGLIFNTSLNSIDFETTQTTGNGDWSVKFRFDRLGSEKRFMILAGATGNGLYFDGPTIYFSSSGTLYNFGIISGSVEDIRNFYKNGSHEFNFVKQGTTLTLYVNGQFFKSITVASISPLNYRYVGRWQTNNAYDYDGLLEYIEINGVLYNSLNNWGGKTLVGVTKTQLYYGEMEDSFMLSGQSNATGRNNQADNAYLGITFPIDKSIYWNNTALEYQNTVFGVNQTVDTSGNWGVEFRNAYNLSQINRQNFLLKRSIGGQSLAVDFNPFVASSGCWSNFRMMNASGRTFKNFLWIQGEADSGNLAWANAYQTNLIEFIRVTRMYSSYGSDMKFIILRLADITAPGYLYNSTIQAAQDYVANNIANVEIVTVPSDWGTIDGQHYNTYTIDEVGKRMFDKLQLRDI
jgi:hypothetical protein